MPRTASILPLTAYLVAVTVVLTFCYMRPLYNWDMLAYAAVVLDDGQISPDELHEKVYHVASEEIPVEPYSLMADTTHYLRKQVLQSPERFYQFLSFFRVKPLYTALCNFFYSAG